MGLGTNHYTTTETAPLSPTLYARMVLDKLTANKPALSFFTDYSGMWNGEGKGTALVVPKPATFAKYDKSADTPVTFQKPSIGSATITLNQHYEVSFMVEDAVKGKTRDIFVRSSLDNIIDTLADAVDTYILGLGDGFATTVAASTNTGDNLYANFLTARKTLNAAKVSGDGRGWFLGPDMENRCMNMTQFINSQYRGSTPVESGSTGGARFLGADVMMCHNIEAATVTTTTDDNFYAHKSAIGYIIAVQNVVEAYHAEYLGTQYTAHILFGATVLDTARGVLITSVY